MNRWLQCIAFSSLVLSMVLSARGQDSKRHIEYYRLVKGFVAEKRNAYGWAEGSGFASQNKWGQYTAFLMTTNARGERTFRIEHYLPNPDGKTSQGSTMYLLEGSERALLIDTANPAKFTPGVNDLKTVVRYLLGHEDDGSVKKKPLDFVVANTHNHPDHIGENELFSDRTVYYMDLDWPVSAPANYVPIREGGGPTNHGSGTAVSAIDLGDRRVVAVAIPPHSPGSTAYLDAENRMIFTGDAIGSSWPYLQAGPLSVYQESIHHLENVTRPYPDLIVFPAHFYQIKAWQRGKSPLNGRPLDRQYIKDMAALADGVLDGTTIGEPFFASEAAFWATKGTAQMVYTLPNFYRPGENGTSYHAVRIPGNFVAESAGAPQDRPMTAIASNGVSFFLIHDQAGESMFLLRGSKEALLIGTGGGEPGLEPFIRSLIGDLPLAVAVLDKDPRQTGGLAQLHPTVIYVADAKVLNGIPATVLSDGAKIDLGSDGEGSPLALDVSTFRSDGVQNMALSTKKGHVLFAGNVFERKEQPSVRRWEPTPTPEADKAARQEWYAKVKDQLKVVYLATSTRWFSDAAWLEKTPGLAGPRTAAPDR